MKVGIIGNGFGRYGLLPAFENQPGVKVVAVCAKHDKSVEQLVEASKTTPRAYTGWESMLDNEQFDVLAAALPPAEQFKFTKHALASGCLLFLEKQIASSFEESKQLYDLYLASHYRVCINFLFTRLKTWQMVKYNLSRLGSLRGAFINWHFESFDNSRKTTDCWKTDNQRGGGILSHFLSHVLHYVEALFGHIKIIFCELKSVSGLSGPCFAMLYLEMACGLPVTIAASSASFLGTGHVMEIYGDEGMIIWQNSASDFVKGFEFKIKTRDGYMSSFRESELSVFPSGQDSRVVPAEDMIRSFLSGSNQLEEYPTLTHGHRVQYLIDLATRSSRQKIALTVD